MKCTHPKVKIAGDEEGLGAKPVIECRSCGEDVTPTERCNVCGRELIRSDEKAIGACVACMNERCATHSRNAY
jgi:hypothetical protein